MKKRELLSQMGYEESIVFDPDSLDDAIIGVSTSGEAIYSYESIVQILMKENNWSRDISVEWVEFNMVRALPCMGDTAPVIVHSLD